MYGCDTVRVRSAVRTRSLLLKVAILCFDFQRWKASLSGKDGWTIDRCGERPVKRRRRGISPTHWDLKDLFARRLDKFGYSM